MNSIEKFTWHNSHGESTLYDELDDWVSKQNPFRVFGPITKYTWYVNGIEYERHNIRNDSLHILPDKSGFVCIEKTEQSNNCTLINAFGSERLRIDVPLHLIGGKSLKIGGSEKCYFYNVSAPYVNPLNGISGVFGLIAFIEDVGEYYFELDYSAGVFLWSYRLHRE